MRGFERVFAASGVEEDGVAVLFYPPVLAGKHALFPFAKIIAVPYELDHFPVGRMSRADGNVFLGQDFGFVRLVLFIEEHVDLVSGIVGFCRFEKLKPGIGHVRELLGQNQPGGYPVGSIAHHHVDTYQLFAAQALLGLFKELTFLVAEIVVDVVFGLFCRPGHGLRLHHQVIVFGADNLRLFHGQRPELLVCRVVSQPFFFLRL